MRSTLSEIYTHGIFVSFPGTSVSGEGSVGMSLNELTGHVCLLKEGPQ